MAKPKVKEIALVESYQAIGEMLRICLSQRDGLRVSWVASSGKEALKQCGEAPPDVIVLGLFPDDMPGMEGIQQFRESAPNAKIVVFAGALFPELVHQMVSAGVHGIVAKSSPLQSLLTAIEILSQGGCYFDSAVEPYLHAPTNGQVSLTGREKTILRLVAEGNSTKEIADQLAISFKTVEKFREHIMTKLKLHDAIKLTRYALRTGISSLSLDDPFGKVEGVSAARS